MTLYTLFVGMLPEAEDAIVISKASFALLILGFQFQIKTLILIGRFGLFSNIFQRYLNLQFYLGRNVSCDEQTIGFQRNHRDKQRLTHKKEGDGFLADCICSDGYTYAFWFRHQESRKQIIQTAGCSPLHARVLALISQLPDKYCTIGTDNIYNSAKFCRLVYSAKQNMAMFA